ncbi:MAG: CBS domain-containing protein [Desulfobacteraceae bacterium]|nr:MAG: CBS domain-containing protein [Desulfobacteraceae bacterium]
MLVMNWMNKKIVTIDVKDSMQDAITLLKEHDIRMLPVMKKGKLVGVVTDRDLKRTSASDVTMLEIHELLYLLAKIKVEEIMTKNPITVPFDYTVEEAAEVLLTNKISGAPVVDHEGQIVGTIAQTDIFRAVVSLTGLSKRGISFCFIVEDRSGSIKEVTDIIRRYGGRMASILSSYERIPKGYRRVYVRMYNVDHARLPLLKEELKEKADLLYMADHHERIREIYEVEDFEVSAEVAA